MLIINIHEAANQPIITRIFDRSGHPLCKFRYGAIAWHQPPSTTILYFVHRSPLLWTWSSQNCLHDVRGRSRRAARPRSWSVSSCRETRAAASAAGSAVAPTWWRYLSTNRISAHIPRGRYRRISLRLDEFTTNQEQKLFHTEFSFSPCYSMQSP